MQNNSNKLEELSINTIRFLAVDAVQKANAGHPGMPMGCAPIGYLLYRKIMKHNPANPKWLNRDRFILSAGHGSMLLYSLLHLCGYNMPIEQLKQFRQWGSITPGHPEFGLTDGVETTTGPLGQGISNSVGMAIAQAYLQAIFNKDDIKILDHYIYGICSDGDLMEGVSHEAASLAGHLKLGQIIFFYDNNGITIDGPTSLSFSEDVGKRFEAYGWHVQHVEDVNNLKALELALNNAQQVKDKPSIIITRTHIGYGSPNKQDKASSHGSPLGEEEVKLTKQNLGWPLEPSFFIPQEVSEDFKQVAAKGKEFEESWNNLFKEYESKYPKDAKLFKAVMNGDFGEEWKNKIPVFKDDGKKMATRSASGKVLNAIAEFLPTLIGGSADLAPSNDTFLTAYKNFSAENRSGRNFHFGIREHGMASILNGMATYGGIIPYGGTFLVFSDYARGAIRLGSISHIRPIYVFTHDSIGLGEDGPTHQPIEHFAALRAIPGLLFIRPADANETAQAWRVAIEHKDGPVAIILTRQGLPVIDQEKYPSAKNLEKGAYIIKDCEGVPDVLILASGSEVSISIKAGEMLQAEGIKARVVSFPCWELFDKQPKEYKDSVLPNNVKARVSVEAGVNLGWEKFIGLDGASVSIEKFGASAPGPILMEKYGFTPENIVKTVKSILPYKKK
jgi:transketolase